MVTKESDSGTIRLSLVMVPLQWPLVEWHHTGSKGLSSQWNFLANTHGCVPDYGPPPPISWCDPEIPAMSMIKKRKSCADMSRDSMIINLNL